MKISACWITKNEAANIQLSIESVSGIADELIVVDTGSADGTCAIAESLGARVAGFEWVGDFSAARNYALSLASGDIVVFLDADEWFEPALGQADRRRIEETFSMDSKIEAILTKITNVDRDTREEIGTNIVCRIFLRKDFIRYKGKIHEYLDPTGRHVDVLISDSLGISHSGYSKEVAAAKLDRNIALLEAEAESAATGSDDRVRFMIYLTREHHNRKEFAKCAAYMAEILKHPRAVERLCHFHSQAFIPIMYPVMWTAFRLRAGVSRRDVRQKLFGTFKKVYASYPGSAEIDLLYQALFDMKEDRFLREFEPAVKAAAAMKPSPVVIYKENERFLYEKAAHAAWRRGYRMRAMDYAVSAMKGGGKFKEWLLCILLSAVKDQPPEDVIFLLNGIYKISEPDELDFLIGGTCVDGFQVVHSYYLKKRMDSDRAYVDDYLRFMLAYGEYDAAAEAAAGSYEAGNKPAAWYLFLAAVCGASRGLIDSHADMLEDYAHVLNAYYNGERLAAVPEADAYLLRETYRTAAFVSGLENADKYLDVFRADPSLCLSVKAAYCEISGLHDQILREDASGVGRLEFDFCWRRVIQAMILTGRHDEAVREIEAFLKDEFMEPELVHMLLVAAEQGTGDVRVKARRLYKEYSELYDALVELDDMITTGSAPGDGDKKQNLFFRGMNRAQFDKYIRDEAARPAFGVLLGLCREAADVYRKNGFPAEAARCLCRVIAHWPSEAARNADYDNLADIFTAMKNPALAAHIRGLAHSF